MLGGRLERLGEHRHLHGAVHVFQGDERHAVAALGGRLLERGHLAEQEHAAARTLADQIPNRRDAERLDHRGVAGQRVPGNVEPQDFLLEGQPLIGVPLRHHGHRFGLGAADEAPGSRSKNEAWPSTRSRCRRWPASSAASTAVIRWARGSRRESNAPALMRLSSTRRLTRRRSTRAQKSSRPWKRPSVSRVARIDLHRRLAHVLDGGQPEADRLARHAERHLGHVDVGGLHTDPHGPALFDVLHDLVGVAHFRGEQRRHELHRVVRLAVGRLVGDQPVRRAVALVEAVAGELLHQLPDALGLGRRRPPLPAAGDELVALLGHEVAVLLAHGPAQRVRLPHGEARHLGGDLHDLLLVDHDPVRLPSVRLHGRVLVRDLGPPVPPVDEVRDQLHRSRPVERDHGDDVLQALGPEAAERVAHARRLQLEHAEGLGLAEELVGRGVVEGDLVEIELDPPGLADQLDRVGEHGEGAQPQEVHLEQAELLDRPHGVAGDELRALGILVERNVLVQRLVGDHHGRGVHGSVPRAAFQGPGDLPELLHLGLGADHLGERAATSGRRPPA